MEREESAAEHSAPSARDVGRALSWMGAGQAAGQVWWYTSLVVLAALLPPRAFGTIAAGLVVVNVAQYLMDSGTRGSLIIAPTLSRGLLRRALRFNLAAGALLTIVIALMAEPFVETFAAGGEAGPIRLLALSVLFASLVPVPAALLQRSLNFKRHAAVLGVSATVASIVAMVAAVAGAGVWALALRQVLLQALTASLSWWNARALLPAADAAAEARRPARQEQAFWFFALSLSQFLALNVDYLVVGSVTDARELGLYSLAFMFAFAPVTQFSSQIGKVMFPAVAATRDRTVVARRAVKATRLLALAILPFVPPAIAVAPALLPGILGPEWVSMVVPFQILLVAGAGTALLSVVQESLSGTGNVRFFAQVSFGWLASMFLMLMILVRVEGLRGAALTHLVLLVPLTAVYATWGARRIGLRTRSLLAGLRGIAAAVAAQAAVTAGTVAAASAVGAPDWVAAVAGALLGLALVFALLWRQQDGPLQEARELIATVRSRAAA